MTELFSYYFEHVPFVFIHAILLTYLIFKTLNNSGTFAKDRHLFEFMIENRESYLNGASYGQDDDEKASPALFYLKSLSQANSFRPQEDVSHLIDSYVTESEDRLEWCEKIASLFLLSGIVGTLVGIFQSVNQFDTSGIEVNLMLKSAFQAFGVTIFAVLLSVFTSLTHLHLKNKLQKNAELFKVLSGYMLDRSLSLPQAMQEQASQILDITVAKLSEVVEAFQSGITSEPERLRESFVAIAEMSENHRETFSSLKMLIDTQMEAVTKIQHSLSSLPNDLAISEAKVNDAFSTYSEKLQTVINDSYENFSLHRSYSEESIKSVVQVQNDRLEEVLELMNKRLHHSVSEIEGLDQQVDNAQESLGQITQADELINDLTKVNQELNHYLERISLLGAGAAQPSSGTADSLQEMIRLQREQIRLFRTMPGYRIISLLDDLWSKVTRR